MSDHTITYADKIQNSGATPEGRVSPADMNEIKSVVNNLAGAFVLVTVAGELSTLRTSYDAAVNGTATFTLPAPTVARNGLHREFYRTGAHGNYVSITGHIAGNASGERRLGLTEEYFKFVCDGVTWHEEGHSTQAFCTPQITAPINFTLTTGFTKLIAWDTSPVFETPGRLLWDNTNKRITIPVVESLIEDGYSLRLSLSLEFTNNKTVTGVIAVDGTPVNGEFTVNGLGVGKPVALPMILDLGVPAGTNKTLEIQLKGESAGTLNILSARWTVSRIKG